MTTEATSDALYRERLGRLRQELQHPPFHQVLRPELESLDPQTWALVVRLPYRPEFARAAGENFYHGGVISALCDLAGHAAVAVQTGRMAPTVDLRLDFLRPAPGVSLLAAARVLRLGRTLARADVEITDENHIVLAVARGTFMTEAR